MNAPNDIVERDTEHAQVGVAPGTSRRAIAISGTLRLVARRAAGIGARRSWLDVAKGKWSVFSIGVAAGFVAVVLLPFVVAAIYFGAIASRQFVSEMRFAVRSSSPTNDLLGGLTSLANTQRAEDALVIADYVRSRRLFEELDSELDLRRRYGRSDVDYFSRLDVTDPIEDLVLYWRSKVHVKIDKNSGVVTVTVRAFSPEDALSIAKAIGEHSELLVNELLERSQRDALAQAERDLRRAEQAMQATIESTRQTRNAQGVLDAIKAAEAITKVVGELRGKLLALEAEYKVQSAAVSASAPQMKILASRMENLRQQIASLERRIASNGGQATLTDSQSQLEREEIDRKVAQQQYALAAVKFEQARFDQATKHVYLMTFVPPRLAEDALYPKRVLIICIVLGVGLLIWGIGIGVAVLIRDHVAV